MTAVRRRWLAKKIKFSLSVQFAISSVGVAVVVAVVVVAAAVCKRKGKQRGAFCGYLDYTAGATVRREGKRGKVTSFSKKHKNKPLCKLSKKECVRHLNRRARTLCNV